jgi:ABC-type tungstate transport system substrate-binding protein
MLKRCLIWQWFNSTFSIEVAVAAAVAVVVGVSLKMTRFRGKKSITGKHISIWG